MNRSTDTNLSIRYRMAAHKSRNSLLPGGIPKLSRSAVYRKRALYKRAKVQTPATVQLKETHKTKEVQGEKNGGSRQVALQKAVSLFYQLWTKKTGRSSFLFLEPLCWQFANFPFNAKFKIRRSMGVRQILDTHHKSRQLFISHLYMHTILFTINKHFSLVITQLKTPRGP